MQVTERKAESSLTRRRFLKASGCAMMLHPLAMNVAYGMKSTKIYRNNALLGEDSEISISPSEGWRDRPATYTFTIKLGKTGLSSTDSLGIVNGSYLDLWQFTFPSHFWNGCRQPWHTAHTGTGRVTASCSQRDARLNVLTGEPLPSRGNLNPAAFIKAMRERKRAVLEVKTNKDLKAGDVITLTWHDVSAPPYAMNYLFMPFIFSKLPKLDRDLPIKKGEFDHLPRIRVKGHNAAGFHVTCQPLQTVNQPFTLKIAAIDEYGNPAEDFEGAVKLNTDKTITLPDSISFDRSDRGFKSVNGCMATQAGWFKINASSGKLTGYSNYVVVSETAPAMRLYFGDMHTHTLDCDATNDIHEHFHYAPNIAGLDFGAVSCHAEYFGCASAWQRYLNETSKANKPGEFVTFPGYEWAQQGHCNAYFLAEDETVLIWGEARMRKQGTPTDDPPFRVGAINEAEFMSKLKNLKQTAFAIAHCHTSYSEGIDDSMLLLDEIYSCHKFSRQQRENRLRTNLAKGLRLGVVAGSDMHRLTMGHLCKQPGERWPQGGWESCQFQTAGLQATYSEELTRQALYEGMRARNTYGTSGARIVLFFSCNEHPMGSQIELDAGSKPAFKIEVGGTAQLSEVTLCRYDGKTWTEPFVEKTAANDQSTLSWQDDAFNQRGIYYVRVTQTDGEQAWSSPIWINS